MDKNSLQQVKKVMGKMKKGVPFLMTVSIFDKRKMPEKDMDTYILVNDFPYSAFDGAKKMAAKLINEAKKKAY